MIKRIANIYIYIYTYTSVSPSTSMHVETNRLKSKAVGPLGLWASGVLGPWASGPVGHWAFGPLGFWAHGHEGTWAFWPLGLPAHGPKGPRASNIWANVPPVTPLPAPLCCTKGPHTTTSNTLVQRLWSLFQMAPHKNGMANR